MRNIVLVYGTLSGLVVISGILMSFLLADQDQSSSLEWLGYLIMVIALSIIFFGIKRQRDRNEAGQIGFLRALMVGALISLVAAVAYVVVWEIYLAATGSAFIEAYASSYLAEQEAGGVTGDALEAARAEMATMVERYASPLYRIPITFLEILPVGILISLISAAILRNPRVLPARNG